MRIFRRHFAAAELAHGDDHCRAERPTEFLGRVSELDTIQLMLESPGTRLLTITGPGGAGKTRLGLQVAAEQLDRAVDGLQQAGTEHNLPWGLLARAALRRFRSDFGGAATDLTEHGLRGFVIVDVEPGGAATVEHVDAGIPPVATLELDVSGCEDDVQVAEAAGRALTAGCIPVVRLVGEPAFPLDADAIALELAERHGHAQVLDETRYYAAERLTELAGRDTVVGHVVRLGRERIQAAVTAEGREVAQRALRVALRAMGVD